eukprot:3598820-Rhodomonas_salina.2
MSGTTKLKVLITWLCCCVETSARGLGGAGDWQGAFMLGLERERDTSVTLLRTFATSHLSSQRGSEQSGQIAITFLSLARTRPQLSPKN